MKQSFLDDYQKQELADIFEIELDSEVAVDIFLNIDFLFKDNFISLENSKKVKINEQIKLLREIEKHSKIVRQKLALLKPLYRESIDGNLGSKFNPPYSHPTLTVGDQPALVKDPLPSIEVIKVIEQESSFEAWHLKEHYGSGHMEWDLEAAYTGWPYQLGFEITCSPQSKFIKYLNVLFKHKSIESLEKIFRDSTIYKQLKNERKEKL